MKSKIMVLIVMLPAIMTACTWVKESPSAEKVRLLEARQVEDCKKLGKTTTSVLAKVGFVARNEETVTEELATLARNSAADMGGNAIVPVSKVVDGEQSFAVYHCSKP
ncbi:MAG: DUF4156 domain-containing protein [Mariprofundaceae bacterium]